MLIISSFGMEIHQVNIILMVSYISNRCCKPKSCMTISLSVFSWVEGYTFQTCKPKNVWASFCSLRCYQHLGRGGGITLMIMYLCNCNVSCSVTLLHSMITYGNQQRNISTTKNQILTESLLQGYFQSVFNFFFFSKNEATFLKYFFNYYSDAYIHMPTKY